MTLKECINDFNLLISLIHFFIDTLFPKYNNKVSFFGLLMIFISVVYRGFASLTPACNLASLRDLMPSAFFLFV